ncbi:MAG TPA: hypothetical protein VNO51_01050 [Ilumatobacteraceae bacterium]|nr:hypothetical protein [Ilumatobacteraceae bacterium]
MCANCLSTAEVMAGQLGLAIYALKNPVHRALAAAGLANGPDPIGDDVRTIAFLRSLDLDPVAVLGPQVVAAAERWTAPQSVPVRDRLRTLVDSSIAPIRSHHLIANQ